MGAHNLLDFCNISVHCSVLRWDRAMTQSLCYSRNQKDISENPIRISTGVLELIANIGTCNPIEPGNVNLLSQSASVGLFVWELIIGERVEVRTWNFLPEVLDDGENPLDISFLKDDTHSYVIFYRVYEHSLDPPQYVYTIYFNSHRKYSQNN